MTPYLIGGVFAAVAVPLGPLLGRLAGRRPSEGAVASPVAGAIRAGAAVAAIVVAVGRTEIDLVLLAALAAVVVGRRSPALALAVGAMAAAAAVRVGSSSLADVTGAHAVLGPALFSPRWGVALATALALAAGLVALVVVTPAPASLRDLLSAPDRLADVLAPAVVGLVVLVVTLGPPLSAAPGAGAWTGVRVALLAGALPAAALARRLPLPLGDAVLGPVAAGLAGAALLVGMAA